MNVEESKNYYDVLEVATHSTLQDIHNAYTRAKNAYTGDSAALYSLMKQSDCDRILDQIEEAYCILGVPDKRREYDKVKGLNQTHTPEGFVKDIASRPSYKPQGSLTDLLDETNAQHEETFQKNILREEFKYQQEHSIKNETSVSKIQAYKKFGLNYEEKPEFEQEIENCTQYTGDFLLKVREYKGITIERMSEMTKVSKTYIRNIEANEFSKLPADVYTRGFVYQYAKCLKLNPDFVATSYIQNLKQSKAPS